MRELSLRIELTREEAHERKFCRYLFCTRNIFNIVIVFALNAITISNLGQIWFVYDYLKGRVFEHTFVGSASFLLGASSMLPVQPCTE